MVINIGPFASQQLEIVVEKKRFYGTNGLMGSRRSLRQAVA
jgi:hypothetical protein